MKETWLTYLIDSKETIVLRVTWAQLEEKSVTYPQEVASITPMTNLM